jgi:hypothetical protein
MKTGRTQSVIRNTISAGIIAIAVATMSLVGATGDAGARTNELRMEHAAAAGVRTATTPAGAHSYLRNRTGFLSE